MILTLRGIETVEICSSSPSACKKKKIQAKSNIRISSQPSREVYSAEELYCILIQEVSSGVKLCFMHNAMWKFSAQEDKTHFYRKKTAK